MQNVKYQMPNGYTLIEILVVISLIAVVFVSGFTSYRGFQERQQLEAAARQIRTDLRLAQEYSIATRKPDTTPDNICEASTLQGYQFTRVSNATYRIEAKCSAGLYVVKGPISLPSSITMSTIPGGDKILFQVLGYGIASPTDVTITLTHITTSTTTQIVVTPSGEIR